MQAAIFVISLPGSVERQQWISEQMLRQGLAFDWVEGVNGRGLGPEELDRLYSADLALSEGGRPLSPGEIGCALSHLKIYQAMLEKGIELALVCEDDATLDTRFAEQLAAVCAAVDWQKTDLLLLSHIEKYTDWGARPIAQGLRLIKPVLAYNGNGYLLTRRGAEKLLARLRPVHLPADCWNYLRREEVLTIRGIVPYLVNHSELSKESLIGSDLRETRPEKRKKRTLRQQLKRVFYDKFLYQILVKPLLRIRRQPISW